MDLVKISSIAKLQRGTSLQNYYIFIGKNIFSSKMKNDPQRLILKTNAESVFLNSLKSNIPFVQ